MILYWGGSARVGRARAPGDRVSSTPPGPCALDIASRPPLAWAWWPGWVHHRTPGLRWRPSPTRGHVRPRRDRFGRVPTRPSGGADRFPAPVEICCPEHHRPSAPSGATDPVSETCPAARRRHHGCSILSLGRVRSISRPWTAVPGFRGTRTITTGPRRGSAPPDSRAGTRQRRARQGRACPQVGDGRPRNHVIRW